MTDTPPTALGASVASIWDEEADADSDDIESAILELATRISELESELALTQRRTDRLEAALDKSLDPAPSEFLPEGTDSLDSSVFYTVYVDSPTEISRSRLRNIYQNWTLLGDMDEIDQRIDVLTSSTVFDDLDSDVDVWYVEFPSE